MNSNQEPKEDYKTAMGQRLRSCRLSSGLTQERLSELLDISVKHYSEVERGITGLSVEKLIQLSNILGISLDYLLKGDKDSEIIPSQIADIYHSCPQEKLGYFLEVLRNMKKLMEDPK